MASGAVIYDEKGQTEVSDEKKHQPLAVGGAPFEVALRYAMKHASDVNWVCFLFVCSFFCLRHGTIQQSFGLLDQSNNPEDFWIVPWTDPVVLWISKVIIGLLH